MKRRRSKISLPSRNSSPWNEVLSRSLRESMHRHRRLRGHFSRKPTVQGLHALRVETRRQLALVTLAAETAGRRAAKIRRLLKRCLHATAKLRDADVLLLFVRKLLPEYPELGKFRRRLRRQRRRAKDSAQRRLQRHLKDLSRRVRALAAEMVSSRKAGRPADVVTRVLRESADEVRKLSVAARRDKTQLHRARVALKRLRYMVEALGDWLGGAEQSWVEALRRTQHAMGEINDLDVLGSRLCEYVAGRSRERRRLRRARAAVALRQRRLRQTLPASAPPIPVRLRRLLTPRRRIRQVMRGNRQRLRRE